MRTVTSSSLREKLPEIVNQILEQDQRFIITKNGKEIFALVPINDLKNLDISLPIQGSTTTLSISEAADNLKIPLELIQKWIKNGFVATLKINDEIRISKVEIERLLQKNTFISLEQASELIKLPIIDVLNLAHKKKLKLVHHSDGYKIRIWEIYEVIENDKIPEVERLSSDFHQKKEITTLTTSKNANPHNTDKSNLELPNSNFVTVMEAAKFLGISTTWIYEKINKQIIETKKLNNVIYIDRNHLKEIKKLIPEFKYAHLERLNKMSKEEIAELWQKKILSPQEAAILLSISEATLRKRIIKNEIKAIKVGGFQKITTEELIRFKEENTLKGKLLLTVSEAAKLIGIAKTTLIKLIHQNKISVTKWHDNIHRISQAEVYRFIAEIEKEGLSKQ